MRRATVLIMLAALIGLALPAGTLAARAERFSDTETSLYCDTLTGEAGSAVAFVQTSKQWGAWAGVNFWSAPAQPGEDPPTWVGYSSAVVLSSDGSTLQAAVAMYEPGEEDPGEPPTPVPTGEPVPEVAPEPLDAPEPVPGVFVGEATLTATLAAEGDPFTQSYRDRHGNQLYRGESSSQVLSVSGTLALPGDIQFDLSGCEARRESYSAFNTAPANTVLRTSILQVQCVWQTEDSFVALDATATEYGTWADLWVEDASGAYFGSGEAELTSAAFGMTLDLFDAFDGGELGPVGSADAAASLVSDGRVDERFDFGGTRVSVKGDLLAVDGVLDLTTPAGSRSLDMNGSSCRAGDVRITEISSEPHGPKLRNDTPDRAVALAAGDVASVNTAGAALEPEAPCVAIDPESGEPSEYPLGRTGWWMFPGTGGSVTIDTTESSYDTMVGVYVQEAGEFVPVTCVDDTWEGLQAVVTIDTTAGVTYFIQAGGFAGSAGQLVMALRD